MDGPRTPPVGPADLFARLSESSDPFARIASVSADAIISVDEQQTIVFFNSGAERIFGYAAADVVGKPLDLLLPHRFRGPHARHIASFGESPAVARRMGERLPIAGRRSSGVEFPAEASITKLEVDGRMLFTAVLRDVTDRERAQQTQRFLARVGAELVSSIDMQQTLATVVELAVPILGDWSVVYLAEDTSDEPHRLAIGHADAELTPIVERLRAYDVTMPEAHPAREAMRTLTPLLVAMVDDEIIDRIAPEPDRRELVRALGIASAMFVPLGVRDRATGAICLYSRSTPFDADQFALAEELGRRASLAIENARLYDGAQRAILAREDMMRIVSHDIGNPLSAIFVAAKVARRLIETGASAEQVRPHLDGVRAAGEQIERLIEDLLDVERIHGGQLRIDAEPVPAARLVGDGLDAIAPIAAEKEIALEPIAAAGDVDVLADPHRVRQVFSNLVGNAIRFTPPGGRVRITTTVADAFVEFGVEDNGPGIEPRDLPHVFERFYQGYQGERPLGRGAGLGLTIARGIVEAHGGTMRAESEPGAGARFYFTLPRA